MQTSAAGEKSCGLPRSILPVVRGQILPILNDKVKKSGDGAESRVVGRSSRAIAFGLPGRFIIILRLRPPDYSATFGPVDAKLRWFVSNFA
ncbi:MAG TPA: hypothetical protein VFW23_18430, partial [Tepidisphaeraceae bacterium]|nr:hypothetical protein [Tepidisphaeraceae bacterium]